MLNVIKMDLYRMCKSKYTYIVLAAAMLMMLASVFMSKQDVTYYQQTPSALETLRINEENAGVKWGIYIGHVPPEWCTGAEIPLPELVSSNLQSHILLMFLVVFIVLFAGNENRTGFIKNIACQVQHRYELVIGKLLSTAIFTAVLLGMAVLVIMLGSRIFFGYVHMQDFGKFMVFLSVQFLLHVGYGSVILMFVYLFQNAVASLITGILIAAGILQVADAVLLNVVPVCREIENFSIMNYLTSGNVALVSMAGGNDVYLKAVIIAAVTLAIMGCLSGTIMEKRDI